MPAAAHKELGDRAPVPPLPKENGILRSNQPALLMLLADYAMGDKLAVCIRWHHIRLDFYAHKTVPEQKARVES